MRCRISHSPLTLRFWTVGPVDPELKSEAIVAAPKQHVPTPANSPDNTLACPKNRGTINSTTNEFCGKLSEIARPRPAVACSWIANRRPQTAHRRKTMKRTTLSVTWPRCSRPARCSHNRRRGRAQGRRRRIRRKVKRSAVTARRREETLQDVPISVTAFTADAWPSPVSGHFRHRVVRAQHHVDGRAAPIPR